jgi:hypothetical protein
MSVTFIILLFSDHRCSYAGKFFVYGGRAIGAKTGGNYYLQGIIACQQPLCYWDSAAGFFIRCMTLGHTQRMIFAELKISSSRL